MERSYEEMWLSWSTNRIGGSSKPRVERIEDKSLKENVCKLVYSSVVYNI